MVFIPLSSDGYFDVPPFVEAEAFVESEVLLKQKYFGDVWYVTANGGTWLKSVSKHDHIPSRTLTDLAREIGFASSACAVDGG